MRKNVIVIATFAAIFLPVLTATAQERKKSFFQKAAEFLTPRPAQRVMAPAVRPPNPANARIKDERRSRVEAYTGAMLGWIDSVCELNDEQKAKVDDFLKAQIDADQKAWAKLPNRGEQNGNRDFIPFEFISSARKLSHTKSFERGIKALLTDAQATKFSEAFEAREQDLRDRLVGLAVMVLDAELFIRPDQRKPVAEQLKKMFGQKIFPGLYSFYNNSWPFQRAQIVKRAKLKEVLGDVRYKRFERLTRNNGQAERYVLISTGAGNGTASFNKAIEDQPERIAEAMAVRIVFLQETHNLTDAQAKKLTLAAKGAAGREIDKWIEASEKQLQSMREQFANQNVSWGMSLLQVSQVERNKLWVKTRDRMLSKGEDRSASHNPRTDSDEEVEQVRAMIKSAISDLLPTKTAKPKKEETKTRTEREQYQRNSMVSYLGAIVDQEVWLRPDQREPIDRLVGESVSEFQKYNRYSDSYSELQMLADVLFVPSEKAVKEILDEHQFGAWSRLKGQFQVQANNNMVKISYRHGDVQFPFVAGRGRR